MTPEQAPTPEDNPLGHSKHQEERSIYRIPLSVHDTSVGFALLHLDQNSMPARIELVQNTPPTPRRAFEITIEEPELRRFFDLQKLTTDLNGNTIASIREMLSSAIDYARGRGLVYPTEAREEDTRSLFSISVPDSNHTVSYITSHIPISLDEWTYGHKRHHISAIRKDSSDSKVASLTTESLEYPDGSIRLNVTINNYLFDQQHPTVYHFSTCARGASARAALTIELESLHNDITTLPIVEFLTPYFSKSDPTKTPKDYGHSLHRSTERSKPKENSNNFLPAPNNSGMATLSQGAKIVWDLSHNQANLNIYPHVSNSAYYISYTQVSQFYPSSRFFRLLWDITSESYQRTHEAVSVLSSKDYTRLRISLKENLPSDVLCEKLIETLNLESIRKLPTESLPGISHADETFAVLEGKEWLGFERKDHLQSINEIPHQMYLRVWQGACDKIVLTSNSKLNCTITIRARTGDLFSGSIPEMRQTIGDVLKIFSVNPFRILKRFEDASPYISPLYGSESNPALLARLCFFSELLLEDSKRPQRLFSPSEPADHLSLLAFVASHNDLALLTNSEGDFAIRLDFNQDQLRMISVLKKSSFWRRLLKFGEGRGLLLKQKISASETLSAHSVVTLCHQLHGHLENHWRDPEQTRSARNLSLTLQSLVSQYLQTPKRMPEDSAALEKAFRIHT